MFGLIQEEKQSESTPDCI
ncbi:hypothetical protein ACIQZM_12970 [Peribacillus sp. NPDC097206]